MEIEVAQMSEFDRNENSSSEEEEYKTIRLKRHLWPDEVALRNEQKKVKRLKTVLTVSVIMAVLLGWLFGSIFPAPGTDGLRGTLRRSQTMDSSQKIKAVFNIMENDWYFGQDIEDIDTRLTDQAMRGITANEEDPHTEYMSAEEVENFTQSINRNFTGIGVEYITNAGNNIITKIFKGSPAEKAGVQPGDMIISVDGVLTEGKSSDEIKDMVRGESGTTVVMGRRRQGTDISVPIVRGEINATVYGYQIDDETGYLQLYQFGNTTAEQMDDYLDEFVQAGAHKLIIDLRDNGGGYLDALQKVASRFLPAGTVVMKQEYTDGTSELTKTVSGHLRDISDIVILVNGNTASASEVLTLALMEQRDDVTVIGTKTYGKGTVQITKMFTDNSAVKYTTSRWLSPSDVWINGTGIEPDIEVDVPEIIRASFPEMAEDAVYDVDSVANEVKLTQMALAYLGYTPDRTDGYYTEKTAELVVRFQQEYGLEATGKLDSKTYDAVFSAVLLDWNTKTTHDVQLLKALEVLHG